MSTALGAAGNVGHAGAVEQTAGERRQLFGQRPCCDLAGGTGAAAGAGSHIEASVVRVGDQAEAQRLGGQCPGPPARRAAEPAERGPPPGGSRQRPPPPAAAQKPARREASVWPNGKPMPSARRPSLSGVQADR